MADRMYLVIAGVVALAIGGDVMLNEATLSMFLLKKLLELVDYLEFWR